MLIDNIFKQPMYPNSKMQILHKPYKLTKSSHLLCLVFISTFFSFTFLTLNLLLIFPHTFTTTSSFTGGLFPLPTAINHVVFGIASDKNSWPRRRPQVLRWWKHKQTRGCVFLDAVPPANTTQPETDPPICISGDTSSFRYTFKKGKRSAIRVARVVLETVSLNHSHVRWFVFSDDDTIFFTENLVKTLAKYDHRMWYYIGVNSEIYEQNRIFSFDMAFGGAGFAISFPLAKALARVFDPCIQRYPHLYGSDSRIQSCLAELGVGLTREPGFHQFDVRGDAVGLLAAHPLSPIVSLHHIDHIDPIFPNRTREESIERLFKSVEVDSERMFQQTICYDRWFSWTISVSWGYAIQVFPQHLALPEALKAQETFQPWKKSEAVLASVYTLNTRQLHPDLCKRPTYFFIESVKKKPGGVLVESVYRKYVDNNCTGDSSSPRQLEEIRVQSTKLDLDYRQVVRRQCCDLLPSSGTTVLELSIRNCEEDELIYMH
uniref:Uncharacterized protein n=1 Tax=Kalanchoe fedtschenkoi TaxID=63787 RepID=A0A7N0TJD9_KALFE